MVLELDQSSFLKDYVNFNTEKRQKANDSFEKDFFKLLDHAVFGKKVENLP